MLFGIGSGFSVLKSALTWAGNPYQRTAWFDLSDSLIWPILISNTVWKTPRGGWIGVNANLDLNAKLSALNAEA